MTLTSKLYFFYVFFTLSIKLIVSISLRVIVERKCRHHRVFICISNTADAITVQKYLFYFIHFEKLHQLLFMTKMFTDRTKTK